jgi:hypothetical protein
MYSLPRRGYRIQPRVSTLGTLKMDGSPCKGERCGYEMDLAPIAVQKLEWVMETCYNCAIGTPISTLLGRSIWRPFRARRVGWSVPRVETLG